MKLAITHHSVCDSTDGSLVISTDKPLAFVLDEPKEPKEQKEKKGGKKRKRSAVMNAKSFGATVDISKMKGAARFIIAWRARLSS